jgi:Carboxypeptidase regulatory-like domain/TonB dependent receptor
VSVYFVVRVVASLISSLFICVACMAQNTGALRGRVADPSGAVVPGAVVTVKSSAGATQTVTSGGDGTYAVNGLAPGQYAVSVSAQGFSPYSKPNVNVATGRPQTLDIPLELEVVKQNVEVESEGNTLDTAPANNANTVVIQGKDLDELSDDPDELQSELQALAGPSAGPSGGQMYIDGFTAGQLPPKSAIREIRINSNPFSAQYDKLGYGRIEIFTKPGTDKFHGQVEFLENNSIFNSKNPFSPTEPAYHSEQYEGNFGGPLGKKASFFIDAQRRNINDVEVVDPQCGSFALSQCAQTTVPHPLTRTNISPRIDYQLTSTNTLTARYQFFDNQEQNNGVGQSQNQVSLPSLAYNTDSTEHTVQISDTQVFGAKVVNETRFQYLRQNTAQTPFSTAPQLSVAGVFTTGGNSIGHVVDRENHYEIQNYTSVIYGNHSTRFGGRLRISQASNESTGNFNGTFSYPSLTAFINNQPNQFSVATGQPLISDTFVDVGLYAEDDWKLRPNLTLSYGLRYETQTDINDHADFAPRIGIAWGIGKSGSTPKTVLRAGFGIFYDRFPQSLVLQADRVNGVNEQSFVVESPSFGPGNIPPSFTGLTGAPSTVYRIDPHLRAPYVMQTAVGIERQITKTTKLTLTYLNSRGLHQLFTDNINSPFPGTFPANPVCPFGCATGNIYSYESEGIFKQNQLIANLNMRAGPNLSLFGFYTLNYANSDTLGAGSFPTNPDDPSADYGRSPFDVRHRLFLGGTFLAPLGLRLSPFIIAQSGAPYNITIPENILGTSVFNARPGLALGSSGCPVLSTSNPFCFSIPALGAAYTPIPFDFGNSPALFSVNLRVSKTIGIGPRLERGGGGGNGGRGGGDRGRGGFGGFGGGPVGGIFGRSQTDRRYNLTFSVSGRNIFNRENLAAPVSVLSPQAFLCTAQQHCTDFGESIALFGTQGGGFGGGPFGSQANSRRIDLQVQFSF